MDRVSNPGRLRVRISSEFRNVKVGPMANMFGDQLLKAGLVNKDKLNKAKKSRTNSRKQGTRAS